MSAKQTNMDQNNWLNSSPKHLLILSSAGKPVFSLHEDFGSSGLALCALIRALASKTNDKLEMITGAEGLRMVFVRKGELLLVGSLFNGPTTKRAIALDEANGDEAQNLFTCEQDGQEEPVELVRAQLEMLYLHVLFHVTRPALESLFKGNPSYDLAALLGGTEVATRNLVRSAETELCLALDAIPVLPLPVQTRTDLIKSLDEARESFAVFGFLIAKDGTLIAGVGPRMGKARFGQMMPHVRNYLLLANFVKSNPQLASTQMWTPLCLPLFDDSGHFQVYCSSVSSTGKVFLLFLTAETSLDHFHEASRRCDVFANKVKVQLQTVEEHLQNHLGLEDLIAVAQPPSRNGPEAFVIPHHVAVRITRDQSSQYLATRKSSSMAPVEMTEQNGGNRYLVKRYSTVRYRAMEDTSCRVVFDIRTRDAVLWYREQPLGGSSSPSDSIEIFALFPPLTSQKHASALVGQIKATVLKESLRLFCWPGVL